MDFQFCQPKFGALPVLQEYPYSTSIAYSALLFTVRVLTGVTSQLFDE